MIKNNFIKDLRTQKSQSTVEYFVLFAIIATITLVGILQMFPRGSNTSALQQAGEGLLNRAASAMDVPF